MAQSTTNYSFNIAEGTDTVNLLTQCYPNFTSLDSILKEIDDNDVTVASETKSGTVHQLVRSKANRNVIRFSATSNFTLGDTFTVDGTPVTAVTVAGTALQTGDFVINSNVIAILNGALLTVYAGGSAPTPAASDVTYDNSGSGLTATDVQNAIDEVVSDIPTGFAATAISYDNSGSGLAATQVQDAIDELASAGTGSNLSAGVNIASYNTYANAYVCPSDGYLVMESTVNNQNFSASIFGANSTAETDPSLAVNGYGGNGLYTTVPYFMKKGMKIKINYLGTGCSAQFFELS